MPSTPPEPPPPDWDVVSNAAVDFDNAHNWANSYGHDSNAQAIKDVSNGLNYLYLAKSNTTGHLAWALRTETNSNGCAPAKIPTATFAVIQGGSLDKTTGKITAGGKQYLLDARLDGNGDLVAYAKQV